jgi:hypothetical protein
MALDISSTIAVAVSSGGVTWFATFAREYMKTRAERLTKADDREIKIDQHRDQLMLELLAAARSENAQVNIALVAARQESDILRQAQNRSAHFDQCLEHLEILLKARQGGNAEEIKAAERMAQAFVTRMRRLAAAQGTMANEVQVAISTEALRDVVDPTTPPATY